MIPSARATCLDENDLVALASGSLREGRLAEAESHLATCSDCRGALAQVLGVSRSRPTGTADEPVVSDRPLAEGTNVGRFRVLSLVGSGAMGAVYAARDPDLDRKVAVKLLKASGDDPTGERQRRLVREAQAMARLAHPEVITVYEVGTHDGRPFVAMEFVDGTTLRAWRAEGARSWREVLAMHVRAGRGLAAAHDAGLVHRDYKPDNVLVGRDGRVRVTDFGLARAASEPHGGEGAAAPSIGAVDATLTRTGALLGTPAYMAPEQLRGEEATRRSDQYAFAVSLWEALHGERPFEERSLVGLLDARVKEAIRPPPRRARVPRWVRRVLSVAMRADPARRYEGMGALLDALARPPLHARRWVWAACAIAALVGTTAVVGLRLRHASAPPARRTAEQGRVAVALLPLVDDAGESSETAWLGATLAEQARAQLALGEKLRVLPDDRVARALREHGLAASGAPDRRALDVLRTALGAEYVLAGAYARQGAGAGASLEVRARLVRAADGEVLSTFERRVTVADAGKVPAALTADTRRALGVGDPSPAELDAVDASFPKDPEAARLYVSGLARLRRVDAGGARDDLQKAEAIEPGSPLVHAALAEAYVGLSMANEAQSESKLAFERSSGLPREGRLAIEALYHQAWNEWDQAIDIERALWTFFPDNPDYGLRLVDMASHDDRYADAREAIAQLRARPLSPDDDLRVDLADAVEAYDESDFARERDAAASAGRKAQALGARSALGFARYWEGLALVNLEASDRAIALLEESEALLREAGEVGGAARSRRMLATELMDDGQLDRADGMLEELIGEYRAQGKEQALAAALENLAQLRGRQDRLADARALHEEALLHTSVSGGARFARASILTNYASLLHHMGELAKAKETETLALGLRRETGNKLGQAYALTNLTEIAIDAGDRAEAMRCASEAWAIADALDARAAVPVRLSHAHARRASGDAKGAVEELAALVPTLADSKHDVYRADTHREYALALVAVGRGAEALREIDDAEAMLGDRQDPRERRAFGIDAALVRGTAGDRAARADAIARAAALADEARGVGDVSAELTARLVVALLEKKDGSPAAAARLAAIARDARARGFAGIAARAALR